MAEDDDYVMAEDDLYVKFSSTRNFVAISDGSGFRICQCDPFKVLYSSNENRDGLAFIDFVFSSNTMHLVSCDSKQQLMVWNLADKNDNGKSNNINISKNRCIGDYPFLQPVLGLKSRRDSVIAVGDKRVTNHRIPNLNLLNDWPTASNPKGLCAVSREPFPIIIAFPGLVKGQVRVENLSLRKTTFIPAHESELGCMELSENGSLLATASLRGTLVRIFNTYDGTILQEFRRGLDCATINCIDFCPNSKWLAVSSDRGTVHVFGINPAEQGSGLLSRVIPKYFHSERSIAQFSIPKASRCVVSFSVEKNTLFIVSRDGELSKHRFDPVRGAIKNQ